jgi:hypothetical protein
MQINFDAVEKDVKGRLIHNECSKEYSEGAMDALSIVKLHDYDRPTGHWVPKKCNFYWYRQFACSECEHEIICHGKTPNFCEECGADMRGGEE